MSAFLALGLELLQNLVLAFALAMAYGLLARRSLGEQRLDDLAAGTVFGIATIICMLLPIVLAPGVIWDGRTVAVAAAGVFGGPLGATIAAVFGGVYRLALGGAGAPAGVVALILAAGGGAFVGWAWRQRGLRPRWPSFVLLGLWLVAVGLGATAMVPEIGPALVARLWLPLLVVLPTAMLVMGLLLSDQWNYARALQQLEAGERRFRAIFDSQFQSIALLKTDGTVLEANRGSLAFAGIAPDDVIGRPFWEVRWWLMSAETQERMRQAIALAATGRFQRFDVEALGAGFRTAMVDFTLKPIADERGEVVLLVAEGRDVTALRKAEAEVREAVRMQAVGNLTGGVAHEFNNLLQVIIGSADLQLADLPEGSEGARHAERIMAAAQHGAELTQRLLAFSGRQPLRPQPVGLAGAIEEAGRRVRPALPPGVEIVCREEGSAPKVQADSAQLQLALRDILLNAVDALPTAGGRIELCGSTVEVSALEAERLGLAPGRYACLEVMDNGSGMSEEVKAHAFEPFYSTKEVGQGAGLGLSMVQGFARQSGGAVELWSTLGRGTCVRLLLPLARPAPARAEAAEAAEAADAAEAQVALLVEEDATLRKSAAAVLRQVGYRVVEAADAGSALAKLERLPEVALLFTDLGLSGDMSGLELSCEAKRRRPALQVVHLAGGGQAEADSTEGAEGCDAPLLTKPFDRAAVERILAGLPGGGAG